MPNYISMSNFVKIHQFVTVSRGSIVMLAVVMFVVWMKWPCLCVGRANLHSCRMTNWGQSRRQWRPALSIPCLYFNGMFSTGLSSTRCYCQYTFIDWLRIFGANNYVNSMTSFILIGPRRMPISIGASMFFLDACGWP